MTTRPNALRLTPYSRAAASESGTERVEHVLHAARPELMRTLYA